MKYKVSGKERRELKKELSLLKYHVRMFWFYEDIDRVYGCGRDDEWCLDHLNKTNGKIISMQNALNEIHY